MSKINLALILIFTLFLASCTKPIDARYSLEIQEDMEKTRQEIIGELSLVPIVQKCVVKVPIYRIPKAKKCPTSMNLSQCLMFKHRRSLEMRRQFELQVKACIAINKEYADASD